MKLISLIAVVVLLQVSVISQAEEINEPVLHEQNSSAQIQPADKTGATINASLVKVAKTNWGTTIVERKLHLRDGVFSLTLQSTKLYS